MRTAGVTKPAPGGENPLQGATKRLALFEVEHARLARAKFLEERKAKQVCAPLWSVKRCVSSSDPGRFSPFAALHFLCLRGHLCSDGGGSEPGDKGN